MQPGNQTLFHATCSKMRPWTALLLNEGSSTRVYQTYEFFHKRPPSILGALLGSEEFPNDIPLLPLTIKSLGYVAIFPLSSHFSTLVRFLPPYRTSSSCGLSPKRHHAEPRGDAQCSRSGPMARAQFLLHHGRCGNSCRAPMHDDDVDDFLEGDGTVMASVHVRNWRNLREDRRVATPPIKTPGTWPYSTCA